MSEKARADALRKELADLEKQQAALTWGAKLTRAKDDLIDMTEFTMPDPDHPNDAMLSRYDCQVFHRMLAEKLMAVERGEIQKLIITFPPRHGKSELASCRFPAWFLGRDPYRFIIQATYNEDFAKDFGRKVRSIMQSERYKKVFPGVKFRRGSSAADRLETQEGGMAAFVGRGGSITGRGGDLLIIDDPIKNSKEARSETIRNELWDWFNDDMMSRGMTDMAACIIIMTRWHEDDLVGRLTDPDNPHYDKQEADSWEVVNFRAIAESDDPLGREPGAAMWPERFGLPYLEAYRRRSPRGFSSLYQQHPAPEDGDYIKKDAIRLFRQGDQPQNMRIYAASDHAVKTKQENDRTCMIAVGIDENNVMWVLDSIWGRYPPDQAVELMLEFQRKWNPITWYTEKDHITAGLGPFLYKRMREENEYINLIEITSRADKVQKAQPIIARFAQGMIRIVKSHWTQAATEELMKFPNATFDDFVDTMSVLGRGLGQLIGAASDRPKDKAPKSGTWNAFKREVKKNDQRGRIRANLRGM